MTDDTDLQRAVRSLLQGEASPGQLDRQEEELVEGLSTWLDALDVAAHESVDAELDHENHDEPIRVDDPVAMMLGLVADPQVRLDPARLRSARSRAALDVAQLAARLTARSWQVTPGQIARWERAALPLSPALLDALASVLHVEPSQLTADARPDDLETLLDDERISTFLEAWAAEMKRDPARLRQQVHAALVTAGRRRASDASVDALLAVLRTLREVPGFLDSPSQP